LLFLRHDAKVISPTPYYVTRFDITRLLHTQNQTYDSTRNGQLVQYIHFHPALCISLEDGRSAFCCSFLLTLWRPWVDDWRHSEAMAFLELCVINWNFTDSLPAAISLNLEWFVCRRELQRALTWSLYSIRISHPFNTPILSPPATQHPYYYHQWYYHWHKKLPKTRHNLGVRNFYTQTMTTNRC